MDTHKNAPLTPKGREAIVRSVVEGGLSHAAAARQFNTTTKTVGKWGKRFRAEAVDRLRDLRPTGDPWRSGSLESRPKIDLTKIEVAVDDSWSKKR